ncbi:MAG: divalent-cation tolerance protein CutA [Deltaproteobacteria bacterium]|nr:divalent-cation tolerance protein CutA [Deltaproteobacteria bacterium]MBW2354664.1 divalent-cation tolerance protein CutA [Deltaproteobacteria bacterium]HDZ89165.1 divalent-cation tolerance protein CutA [Deltaproteobacteria bacterium]
METNFIYITTGSVEEARTIARDLVSSRLAACANIIDGMNSIYWWDGEVQEEKEVILLAKTRESLVPRLIHRVKAIHSYECPCIVSVPIVDGNPAFMEWIERETRQE